MHRVPCAPCPCQHSFPLWWPFSRLHGAAHCGWSLFPWWLTSFDGPIGLSRLGENVNLNGIIWSVCFGLLSCMSCVLWILTLYMICKYFPHYLSLYWWFYSTEILIWCGVTCFSFYYLYFRYHNQKFTAKIHVKELFPFFLRHFIISSLTCKHLIHFNFYV